MIDLDKEFDSLEDTNTGKPKDLAIDSYIDILQEFFDDIYKREIEFLASNYPKKISLDIDYKKLEEFDLNISERLIDNPQIIIEAANAAIKKIDIGILDSEIEEKFEPIIRFYNLPKEYRVSIRDIGSDHLTKLISAEGTIRLITERLEKLTTAHFVCRKCGTAIDIEQKSQQLSKPVLCRECKSREFDIDLEQSAFIDYQKIQMQEPLESLKGSDQASNIDVYLSQDLVNKCSAGDKILVTGVLKLRPPKGDMNIYGKYIVANHIEKIDQEYDELTIDPEEETQILELSKKNDIYDVLARSIAPNIWGHEVVKEAITLQMFGGVKKEAAKQKLRGNIHILLVGDPSTGKSKLLEYTNILAPKSVYVAGKTVSGAGLTVSAVKDEFGEGGWTLKAGAVILASGGIALIDEFDKISPEDKSSLHEAMAQSTVSVSKAGLYSKFKADCSILAAANPKYNRFDPFKNPIEQIDLPFSLISRFDLYFVIPDNLKRDQDISIAKHILNTQTFAQKLSTNDNSIDKEEYDEANRNILPEIDPLLYKKYVAYSRQNIKPILSAEASKIILDYYISLRDLGRKQKSFAATPRQLEGLIRLSEASAKIKLKKIIDPDDAQRAIRIFKTSLEQTALDVETGKIDIDILATGQSQSERNLVKTVLRYIKDLCENGNPIPTKEVLDFAEKEGHNRDKVLEAISKLKKIGDVYEPKIGLLKPIEQDSF
ncbi:MAG: minichromosome maintenance protein MCM [Candidatus ainarchaeum sp.]|nr:minichromosome maintenance protein MCM [Candidatus ainarchaeum sp.]MDD3975700.1 minichromosome maintenance protein MCM [Candidatus ainarchaeum sp.]